MPQRTWMYQAPANLCFGDHPSVLQLQRSGCGNCWKLADCCGNCCWKLLPCWCWVCLGIRIFTWWTSHFSDLPRTQPFLPTAPTFFITVWCQVTVIVGKALDRLAWEVAAEETGPFHICDLWYDWQSPPNAIYKQVMNGECKYQGLSRRHKIWRYITRERATPHRITPKEAAPTPKTAQSNDSPLL